MKNISITIDGKEISTTEGKMLLGVALEHGIYLPNLCDHPDLDPTGVCRMCIVEIAGRPGQIVSCITPVVEGMKVVTDTEGLRLTRQISLELLHANHTQDCTSCFRNNNCKLQEVTAFVGIDKIHMDRFKRARSPIHEDDSNPFFTLDHNKCIMCGICVRTCDEVQGVNALDYGHRGYKTVISTFGNRPLVESVCESCGECVTRCPVGALHPKNQEVPSREVRTICTYCGVGCNIILGVRGNRIVRSIGNRDSVVNKGRLCVKGRYGWKFIQHPDRLTKPLIKKNGTFTEASWEEALTLIAEKFKTTKGEKFAALSSARITNEENYVIQKFTRAVMETNTVDHCARLCHSPTVAGLAQSLGSGAMTNSISDFLEAKTIFSIGSNTTATHPIIGLNVRRAKRNGAKIIVANPKEIDLCRHADIFLQHRPGTDVALLMGMMKVIVDEGLADKSFIEARCENYEVFAESLSVFTLDHAELVTGVRADDIASAARLYATNSPSSILYAMGITQHSHGTDNVLAISNIALLTGNVGRVSAGVNPLRGQNNVQGACDMGALPDVYPGYQKVFNADARIKFQKAWGRELKSEKGITHTEIFDRILDGDITSLYLAGENPVLSEADANHLKKALGALDFFVVQDIFMTETAKYADVVLPAAAFAEKDGTFTNTERRVQRIRKAVDAPGESKPDWWITCAIAKAMGEGGFDFNCAEEIFEEIRTVTPSYAGITWKRIDKEGLQWPCPAENHPGTSILHSDKFATATGKGRFMPLTYIPSKELPDSEYPLVLTTDRSLYHYHTSTMTRRVDGLNILEKEELLKINPMDAAACSITDGEMVKVLSRRGEVRVKTHITDICPPGVVSLTFHFWETPTNELTIGEVDPVAKIPETKVCSVRVEKVQ